MTVMLNLITRKYVFLLRSKRRANVRPTFISIWRALIAHQKAHICLINV